MFTPIVPTGGLTGWTLLNRTLDQQTQLFNAAPSLQRDTEYFRQNISEVQNAEALVSDRRLLRVALGAFGLGDDINNRAFIKAILEQGTDDRGALANRLSDSPIQAICRCVCSPWRERVWEPRHQFRLPDRRSVSTPRIRERCWRPERLAAHRAERRPRTRDACNGTGVGKCLVVSNSRQSTASKSLRRRLGAASELRTA